MDELDSANNGIPSTAARLTRLRVLPSTTTSGKAVAVILKPLIDLHGEPKNWGSAVPIYIEALKDIPPDLLRKAVSAAITGNRFFPKPAELRASIADELTSFRQRRDEGALAALPLPPPEPPSDMDEEYVARIVAGVTGALTEQPVPVKREFAPTAEQLAAGRAALGLEPEPQQEGPA